MPGMFDSALRSQSSQLGLLARTCQPGQQSCDRSTRHHCVAVLTIVPINQAPKRKHKLQNRYAESPSPDRLCGLVRRLNVTRCNDSTYVESSYL